MCGIVGIYNYKTGQEVTEALLQGMSEKIPYRGPDGFGYFYDKEIALGHRRLTIIDTNERSNQPMTSSHADTTICYNGEVYNYVELKEQLEQSGVTFKTTSDTEVILELYRKKGIDFFLKYR